MTAQGQRTYRSGPCWLWTPPRRRRGQGPSCRSAGACVVGGYVTVAVVVVSPHRSSAVESRICVDSEEAGTYISTYTYTDTKPKDKHISAAYRQPVSRPLLPALRCASRDLLCPTQLLLLLALRPRMLPDAARREVGVRYMTGNKKRRRKSTKIGKRATTKRK